MRVGIALGIGAIGALVVRQRVGVRADDVAMNERRPETCAAVCDGFCESRVAGERISAIDFGEKEVREICDELRNISAWQC